MRLLLIICCLLTSAHADTSSNTFQEPVAHSRFGLYGSLVGDPGVNLFGINLVYEIDPNWRVSAGAGTLMGLANSIGGSIHYLINTGSRFRPFAGIGLTTLFFSSWDSPDSIFLDSPAFTIFYPNLKIGIQYEAPTGFFVGLHWSTFFMFYDKVQAETFLPVPALSIGSFF